MTMIKSPGVYDIPDKVYHADPCPEPSLSSSLMKALNKETPQKVFKKHPRLNPDYQPINNPKFDIGKLAHSMLLDTPEKIVRIDVDSFRSDEAKYYRDKAWKEGKIPVLKTAYEQAELMVESAYHQLSLSPEGQMFLGDGYSEQTICWIEGGIWHRAKMDRITLQRHVMFDYKTTETLSNIDDYNRIIVNLQYHLSAAHYIEGEIQLHKQEPDFFLIVQETQPPFTLAIIRMSGSYIQCGRIRRQKAISIWTWCMKHNKWPGFPPKSITVRPPVFEKQNFLDEDNKPLSYLDDDMKEKLKLWEGWQAPIVEKKK